MRWSRGVRAYRSRSSGGARALVLRWALLALGLITTLAAPFPAAAQYVFIDTNGDGFNSWADSLNSGSTPVDIWLDTGSNRNHSPGACSSRGFTSYSVILKATGGNVTWGAFTPAVMPSIGPTIVFNSTEWHIQAGFGSATDTPLGVFKLGTLVIAVPSGSRCIDIGTSTSMNPHHSTSYGAGCHCKKFDHTNRLGEGWSDRDGIAASPSAPPTVESPGILLPKYLDPVVADIHATPTTCLGVVSSLTADLSSLPAGNNAVFTPAPGNQTGTLTWQPTAVDHGDFPVILRAVGKNPSAVTAKTMIIRLVTNVTGVGGTENSERTFALWQSRPNPFNPTATIRYSLPAETYARLVVYDVSGHVIARLVDRVEPAGPHEVTWSGEGDRGEPVASGVYWYRLTTALGTATRSFVLAR